MLHKYCDKTTQAYRQSVEIFKNIERKKSGLRDIYEQ